MRLMTQLGLRLRALVRGDRLDAELDEELRYHLDRQIELHLAAGMTPHDARLAAMREFGGVDQRREECRDARGVALIDSIRQDTRYALRSLRKTPGFTAVAVASLALGIGANTTIFTFVNAVLLRPLPYPESGRLVVLREQPPKSNGTVSVHPQNYLEWRTRSHAFEALALMQPVPVNVMSEAGAEQATRIETTDELFHVFGVAPILGRGFTAEEIRPGHEPIAVLGYGFWQRRFGGDRDVIGRRLPLADGSLRIVGVAPSGLRIGTMEPDLYTPLPIDPANPASVGSRSFMCFGRLKPGVSLEQARSELAVIAGQLARQYPMDEGYGVFVSTLHDYLVMDGRPALHLLMAVVAAVLVIACVNLAGLLMARGIGRRGELAVRASLGASRGRLVRQLAIESLTLAAAGGAVGLVLAYWATRSLTALTGDALAVGTSVPIALDATCLAFTMAVSVVTAFAFGLVPAWQASRVNPQAALSERSRGGTADRTHHRLRSLLVVWEVAAAIVLMVGAGLLLRTFSSLTHVSLGFEPADTITMRLFLGDHPDDYRVALLERMVERVEGLPGVKAAGTIQFLPLTGMTCGTGVWLEGQIPGDPSKASSTECSLVSRDYFAAIGIPLVRGRLFAAADRAKSQRVVIVNRAFARRYFPSADAVGHRVTVAWSDTEQAEIVGIVGDIRHDGLSSEPAPTVYMLHAQTPGYVTNLVVRTNGDAAAGAGAIRKAIQDVDPTQAISSVKTMEQYVEESLARPRLYAALVTGFAVLALMLAILGVYGLFAYIVGQRTHEIGIRLALGAGRGHVFRGVLMQALVLMLAGLAIGVVAALALGHLMSGLLFGVQATDPATYAIAATLFLIVVLLATAIPARRAARIDPMTALRYE
jgi:predicted permease